MGRRDAMAVHPSTSAPNLLPAASSQSEKVIRSTSAPSLLPAASSQSEKNIWLTLKKEGAKPMRIEVPNDCTAGKIASIYGGASWEVHHLGLDGEDEVLSPDIRISDLMAEKPLELSLVQDVWMIDSSK